MDEPEDMMDEDEPEESSGAAEQLPDFLADACRLLAAAQAGAVDLHALIPPLSKFVTSCCSCAKRPAGGDPHRSQITCTT